MPSYLDAMSYDEMADEGERYFGRDFQRFSDLHCRRCGATVNELVWTHIEWHAVLEGTEWSRR